MVFAATNNDLICDNLECDRAYLARDTWELTISGARSAGWRIFYGPLNSGELVFWATCPSCAGTKRPLIPRVLEGQLDLLEDQD